LIQALQSLSSTKQSITRLQVSLLLRFWDPWVCFSDMVLPDDNCFTLVSSDTICLAMLNASSVLKVAVGPAVILGNHQQQNFYILYDREKNRLGFTHKTCKKLGWSLMGHSMDDVHVLCIMHFVEPCIFHGFT